MRDRTELMYYPDWRDVPPEMWRWPHFSPREMSCRGSGRLLVATVLLDALETLRVTLGNVPLAVTSGYRSPEHNARVSNTGETGPHTTGLAVDIAVHGERAIAVLDNLSALGVTGRGINQKGPVAKRFIHLDLIEPGGAHPRPNVWTY